MTDRRIEPGKAQQPQAHCDHECVCGKYKQHVLPGDACTQSGKHIGLKCPYDTRTHTSASQQRIDAVIKELEKDAKFLRLYTNEKDIYERGIIQGLEAAIALLQAGDHHE